jgi:hypothetical protein
MLEACDPHRWDKIGPIRKVCCRRKHEIDHIENIIQIEKTRVDCSGSAGCLVKVKILKRPSRQGISGLQKRKKKSQVCFKQRKNGNCEISRVLRVKTAIFLGSRFKVSGDRAPNRLFTHRVVQFLLLLLVGVYLALRQQSVPSPSLHSLNKYFPSSRSTRCAPSLPF